MLKSTREARVLRLTLARADKRNAINADLARDLAAGIRAGNADPTVGAILIDAEGPVFSAGMDLDEAADVDAEALGQLHTALFRMGLDVDTPIVAAVQGHALGGGLGVVANAHIVVVAETAEFGLPELQIGMWPFLVWPSIARAIGERRTLELALTSRRFDAMDAVAWGLAHVVVKPNDLMARSLELARTVAGASRETVVRGFQAAVNPDRAMAIRVEHLSSPDFREGLAARKERRQPRWPSNGT